MRSTGRSHNCTFYSEGITNMKVIDSESWSWLLLEHEDSLYLDVNCNIGVFGYTYIIQLNDQENSKYEHDGRKYLHTLAHDIQQSAPIAKDTSSIYKNRGVSKKISELATQAVQTWHKGNNEN